MKKFRVFRTYQVTELVVETIVEAEDPEQASNLAEEYFVDHMPDVCLLQEEVEEVQQ
jgi:hypothetical protein